MARRPLRRSAPLLLALLLASCDEAPVGPVDGGDVVSISIAETPSPFVRAVTVTLSRPAPVTVSWGAAGTRVLRRTADSVSTTHRILLPRLRAQRLYVVEAFIPDDSTHALRSAIATGALPANLAAIGLTTTGTPSYPVALIEVVGGIGFSGLIVLEDGEIVGHLPMAGSLFGMARRANGEFVLNDAALGLTAFTIDGTLVHQLPQATASTPYRTIHHDVIPTPGGKILFIANDTATVTDTLVTGESLWEWDPETGAVSKKWSAFNDLDYTTFKGSRSITGNWLHGNGINFGPRGNVIMSLRNADHVISIAPDFGSVEWAIGPAGTLAVAAPDRFLGQHYASEPSLGKLLVFDNGWERPGGTYSRAIEYDVNVGAATATKVWEYRPNPDIYASLVGSARRLPNGNTAVMFGMLAGHNGSSGPITGVEVTPAGTVAWRVNAGANITRLYRLDFTTSLIGEVEGSFITP